jgi:HEAT repeat protein
MPETLAELLDALRAADPATDKDPLVDAIEALVADDPEGSRAVILAHAGNAQLRVWALGLVGHPADFDRIAAALADPQVRYTALEALANQPDADRVDAVARSLLDDPDPGVRAKAAGMVAFYARPGALAALLPLAGDPVAHVRMVVGWHLGGLGDPVVEPTLRILLTDPDEQVRKFAARGLARLVPG